MKLALLVSIAATLTAYTAAHSWLECTDYQFLPNSDDARNWNPSKCFGNARCGARQAQEGFGVDTGLNHHDRDTCQCARGSSSYDGSAGATRAQYTPGQRVCLAYPSKNHVSAPCTNAFIPDSGTTITRTAVNADADTFDGNSYKQLNDIHEDGKIDYKGFQHCPNFCDNTDKALCTMCFDLEEALAPGDYTFKWTWAFNNAGDAYSTCWEATVGGGAAVNGTDMAPATATPAPTSTSALAPTVTPQADGQTPSVTATDAAADEAEDCENGPDAPVSYSIDGSGEDCENGPDVPVSYQTPTSMPSEDGNGNGNDGGNAPVSYQLDNVEPDDDGPGVVNAYPEGY